MSRVAKWGNSLAVRLPKAVVTELSLRDGDDVVLTPHPDGSLQVAKNNRREEAIRKLRSLRWKLPEGYKFDREEISRRGGRG